MGDSDQTTQTTASRPDDEAPPADGTRTEEATGATRAEDAPGATPAEDAPAAGSGDAAAGDAIDVEGPEDGAAVEELDPETRARRDAALRLVRKFGDPVLRATAVPVERFDEQLRTEAARMAELMHDALGVGLAATQVGILHRLLVYQAHED